jgi:hypothetical protein
MPKRMLRLALAVVFASAAVTELARADIYTWTDGAGKVNVSNLTPPDGTQVLSVVREIPRPPVPPPAPVADPSAQADVQFLAQRVRQLEYEVESSKRQAPPMMNYAPMPPPPPVMQYAADPEPQVSYGCDQAWNGCNGLWGFGGYPVGIVVLNTPKFRRPFPAHGFHRSPMQMPVRGRGGPQRR